MKYRSALKIILILILSFTNLSNVQARSLSLCYGAGCNLADPVISGCAGLSNTYTAIAKWATASSGTVRMDLKYAPTCNSNWTKVTNESPGAVRKLKAELWNSTKTTLITSYVSSSYIYVYSAMYNGSTILCGRGKQGPAGGSTDATTPYGCA